MKFHIENPTNYIKLKLKIRPWARSTKELIVYFLTFVKFETDNKILGQTLKEFGIEKIIDVGANVGQFGIDARRAGFTGTIVSFEPSLFHFGLLGRLARKDPNWEVRNFGLSNVEGNASLSISSNLGVSSSILPMSSLHEQMYGNAEEVRKEIIQMTRLDSQFRAGQLSNTLLKIDVQGLEKNVIQGAGNLISEIDLILIEVSFMELYEGQPNFFEMQKLLDHSGFETYSFLNLNRRSKRLVQIDLIAVRKSLGDL